MHHWYRQISLPRFIQTALSVLGVVCVLPGFVSAEPTLTGHTVEFSVQAFDDPENPYFSGRIHRTVVSSGIEFGIGREGIQNELDVVPVQVNIDDNGIKISYSKTEPGTLASARFNGYVIKFLTDCALLGGARINPSFTNVEIDDKRIFSDATTVMVNVSGLHFNRKSRIVVDLEIRDCPP